MKKTFLIAAAMVFLMACGTKPTETTTTETATVAGAGTITTTGPDVDAMKNSFTAFANGNWDELTTYFADSAVSYHNVWPLDTTVKGVPIKEMIEVFKKDRPNYEGNFQLNTPIVEVVTMADGSKYGHIWIEITAQHKNGKKIKQVVFNSFGINKDGKFTSEWPIYDNQ
ncbi:MAG: hypothetical protein RIT38_142 [Bacteroidota bacterium]|jgi:hypothetical protein